MKCEDAKDNLSAFLDNELPDLIHRELLNHLHHCPECSAEKERLAGTIDLIHNMEIPVLGTNVFNNISVMILEQDTAKSYNILKGMLEIFSILTAALAVLILLSPLGQAILSLVRAIDRIILEVGTVLWRFPARGQLGAQVWLTSALFGAFLLSVWLLRKVLNNPGWGGPVNE